MSRQNNTTVQVVNAKRIQNSSIGVTTSTANGNRTDDGNAVDNHDTTSKELEADPTIAGSGAPTTEPTAPLGVSNVRILWLWLKF